MTETATSDLVIDDVPALRREILACKDALIDLSAKVDLLDGNAALSLKRARSMVFEAWTILCGPPEDDDDH